MNTSASDNPLLQTEGLPRFDRIRAEHVEPAVRELLARLNTDLDTLEREVRPTWQGTVERLSTLTEPLGLAWGVINHLMGVQNSPELRQAHAAVEGDVVESFMRIGQSAPLYQAYKTLREGPEWQGLEEAQKRVVDAAIRDMELSGVGLQGQARERFQAIERELAELSTRFANNVIDSTKAWSMTLTKREEVEGLPPSALAMAAQAARQGQEAEGAPAPTPEAGPWRITLDAPSFGPFMEHSRRADLRETLYRAYITRASSGEVDNNPLIERILSLRAEKARLLGHGSFAEVSLAAKMAPGAPPRTRAPGASWRSSPSSRARRRVRARSSSSCGTRPSGRSGCARSATPIPTRSCGPTSRCRACSRVCSTPPGGSLASRCARPTARCPSGTRACASSAWRTSRARTSPRSTWTPTAVRPPSGAGRG
jgi:oligopeptidase A